MKRGDKILVGILISAILLIMIFANGSLENPLANSDPSESTEVTEEEIFTYQDLLSAIAAGEVASVTMIDTEDMLEGEFIDEHADAVADEPDFTLTYAAESEDEIEAELRQTGVSFSVDHRTPPWWEGLLTGMPPILLFLGLIYFFVFRRMGAGGASGAMSFGKSPAQKVDDGTGGIGFGDVAGIEEAKAQLEEIVEYLREGKRLTEQDLTVLTEAGGNSFLDWGIKPTKGVLLFGPPGTGKTLLARAVAGEAGVPFYQISGSDFVEMFVGVGASRVRNMFDQVKKDAPAILFIDEIDAVGRHRGAGLGGGHDEREQTLNQMLVELDGFEASAGVIVIAATNRPDILDPALLRAGRFDLKIAVTPPDREGRIKILDVHSRGKNRVALSDDDKRLIGKRTIGLVGSDMANIVNEALKVARRRALSDATKQKKTATVDDFLEAVDIVQMGPERKGKVMTAADQLLTAVHEAGHAIVSMFSPNGHPVEKLTITPRGPAGGFTLPLPEEERTYALKSALVDQLAMSLGGRVAEELYLGDISTGASNDFEKATDTAKKMVKQWGMGEHFRYRVYGGNSGQPNVGLAYGSHRDWSDSIAEKLDEEINNLLDVAGDDEAAIILEHYGAKTQSGPFQRLVEALLEHETLHLDQIIEALGIEVREEQGADGDTVRRWDRWTRDDEGNLIPPAQAA